MDLKPGDKIDVIGMESPIFIGVISPHPMAHYNDGFTDLWLVIWRLPNGEVGFDALNPRQEIGNINQPANARSLQSALGIKWG